MGRLRRSRSSGRARLLILAGIVASLIPGAEGFAYTAAGDRIFAATGILPQIAPTDQLYTWSGTVPLAGGAPGARTRSTDLGVIYEKTLTERLGIHFRERRVRFDRSRAGSLHGFQNLETELKYLTVNDHDREFLLTIGVNREWGGTGARRVGAARDGATEPRIYFGKGLGDFDIGYLRPFAITGVFGYQFADARPRPDLVRAGVAVQYSIPYLQSKVQSFDIPELFRRLTPITEILFTIPAGRSFGARTTAMIAPGAVYAGDGWELVMEALVPATRATGRGVGVRAQLNLALDSLFPETIGRPLFARR